jgi:hypothetical protein
VRRPAASGAALFDGTKLQALPAGSYASAPVGIPMFAYSSVPAVVQVHGTGPFDRPWKHGMTVLEEAGAETGVAVRVA